MADISVSSKTVYTTSDGIDFVGENAVQRAEAHQKDIDTKENILYIYKSAWRKAGLPPAMDPDMDIDFIDRVLKSDDDFDETALNEITSLKNTLIAIDNMFEMRVGSFTDAVDIIIDIIGNDKNQSISKALEIVSVIYNEVK